MSRHSLIERPGMIEWDVHATKLLNAPNSDQTIEKRQELAQKHEVVAVFFDTNEIASQVAIHAAREVNTGRAARAKQVVMKNGGKPYHDDKIAAIKKIDPNIVVKEDHIRTSAYDGPVFVGAHVLTDNPDMLPQTLEPGDEVVFNDDGLDTGESLMVSADFVYDNYGITDFSADTALTKQPGLIIAGFRETTALFSTPFGVFGEGYGFDNNGKNRETRIVAVSWNQDPANFERVEHTLDVLGGTAGFAIASIDEIIKYNRERLSLN
ncbi:hypothetical protein KBB49_00100 [Candidatus Saccharibacteria bacterium]|jgi:hypothetical protein|nr:hypothetical protein [Candidatus Saccharibacteria bacterium]